MRIAFGLLLLAVSACGSDGDVNTGTLMALSSERVCISVQAPGGLDKKCFRFGDGTELEDGLSRGDRVEIRFTDGEALSVQVIPSPE